MDGYVHGAAPTPSPLPFPLSPVPRWPGQLAAMASLRRRTSLQLQQGKRPGYPSEAEGCLCTRPWNYARSRYSTHCCSLLIIDRWEIDGLLHSQQHYRSSVNTRDQLPSAVCMCSLFLEHTTVYIQQVTTIFCFICANLCLIKIPCI